MQMSDSWQVPVKHCNNASFDSATRCDEVKSSSWDILGNVWGPMQGLQSAAEEQTRCRHNAVSQSSERWMNWESSSPPSNLQLEIVTLWRSCRSLDPMTRTTRIVDEVRHS